MGPRPLRHQHNLIKADLSKKMVFLTGPRQVGKTWLAKSLMQDYKHPLYLNYDTPADLQIITKRWPRAGDAA
jgi:predicted AAA+ superfamily ATPase